jgi:preprotein translocase subunit SecE
MGKEKETSKKPVPKKDSKGNALNAIQKYFRGVVSELKKVSWPTRKELTNSTAVVVVTIVIFAVIIGIIDFGLGSLLELIT